LLDLVLLTPFLHTPEAYTDGANVLLHAVLARANA
jgi:hypothetical protein